LLLLFILCNEALAGAGMIAVYDGTGKLCEEESPEYPVVHLTSEQAISSLKDWLQGRPQSLKLTEPTDKKRVMFRPSPEIAFTGYIKFCGPEERHLYFSALIEHLKEPQRNERAYVLLLLHSRSALLLEIVRKKLTLDSLDETFRKNLEKAKRLIVYQRKTPEPYPTETVVKRIEKWLKPQAP